MNGVVETTAMLVSAFAVGLILGTFASYWILSKKLALYRLVANEFLYFAGDAKRMMRKYIFETETVKGGVKAEEEGKYGGRIPRGIAQNYIERLDEKMRKWEKVIWEGPEYGGAPKEGEEDS